MADLGRTLRLERTHRRGERAAFLSKNNKTKQETKDFRPQTGDLLFRFVIHFPRDAHEWSTNELARPLATRRPESQ